MSTIGTPKETASVMKKHNFTTQKKFGQNFLIDPNILQEIVDCAGVSAEDHVLEIGPGLGSMTQLLCEQAKSVTAVEIDDQLIPILQETMADYDNFELIHGDILKIDVDALLNEKAKTGRVKVVANLPYYITTPIITELLEKKLPITSITIMVQKEVAERMQAKPGTKAYGALTLAVQYYASAKIVAEAPPHCFMPQPKVSSSVICLNLYETPPVAAKDEKLLFRLIRASFNQRRKTLVNALYNGASLNLSKEEIATAITAIGEKETVRGEALSLAQFAALADQLS